MRVQLSLFAALVVVPQLAFAQAGAVPTAPSQAVADLACSPRVASGDYRNPILVLGGLDHRTRHLVATNELLVVNAGSDRGLTVGSSYLIRRWRKPDHGDGRGPSIDTAGWVVVDSVQENTATARVVWACDGAEQGDILEPFALPTPVASRAAGTPDFNNPGIIRAGRDSRVTNGTGERVLVESTQMGELTPGQRVTFFRRPYATKKFAGPAVVLGEGYVLEVSETSAVAVIDHALMAVEAADLVAAQR